MVGQSVGRFFASVNIWFWAIVGVPALIACVYYFAIASDLYLSEAKFVVYGPARSTVSTITSMFGGSTGGSEDTRVVREFVLSRDAVKRLEDKNDLRALLSRPEGDILTRYPGLVFWRKDFEALYKTYARFVSVEIESESGIATLQVKAYRPEDAHLVAAALLTYSEHLINELNDRARRDALATFEHEVTQGEQRLAKIQGELTAYRIKANMLEPTAEAKGPMALLAQLYTQQSTAKAQLAEVLKNSPKSPQIGLLRTRLISLDKLIAEERAKITGNDNSVASGATEYERLDFQRTMGEKLLASVVASREAARLQAQRQQLYLETIAQPNLADYPLFPKRAVSFATVTASCLLAYGIAWLLVAGVREHASA